MPKIRGVKPDYWTDDDIVDLSIAARLLFIGMWNYACDNGHLQDKSKQIKLRILPADDVSAAELLRELESANRIQRVAGWITIPNFTKHQKPDRRYFQTCAAPDCTKPTDSQPETRGGHAASSDISTPHSTGSLGDGEGDGDVKVMVNKSRPLALPDRADIARICDHLATRIEANGSKRPAITAKWLTAARLMLDNDRRTEQQIHAAIDWCQTDDFWRANILSLPKLREKYDQLQLQAQRKGTTGRKQAETDGIFDRALARAKGDQ